MLLLELLYHWLLTHLVRQTGPGIAVAAPAIAPVSRPIPAPAASSARCRCVGRTRGTLFNHPPKQPLKLR